MLVGAVGTRDLTQFARRLSSFRRTPVTPEDFDHCVACIRRHVLSHGVGWPDGMIAATAIGMGVPVAALNDEHSNVFRGLKVIPPN